MDLEQRVKNIEDQLKGLSSTVEFENVVRNAVIDRINTTVPTNIAGTLTVRWRNKDLKIAYYE